MNASSHWLHSSPLIIHWGLTIRLCCRLAKFADGLFVSVRLVIDSTIVALHLSGHSGLKLRRESSPSGCPESIASVASVRAFCTFMSVIDVLCTMAAESGQSNILWTTVRIEQMQLALRNAFLHSCGCVRSSRIVRCAYIRNVLMAHSELYVGQ